MHVTQVIKKPVLTEKSYLGHANGVYIFIVDKRTNKTQIKKTFEEIFEVKVKSVRTMNYDGKEKNMGHAFGHIHGKTGPFKKAIITLKDGEQLDILNDL